MSNVGNCSLAFITSYSTYITKRVERERLDIGRALRDTRGERYLLTLRRPLYIEERKQTWDERIRIRSKKSDSGCSVGLIVKSNSSNLILLQRIWTREVWI